MSLYSWWPYIDNFTIFNFRVISFALSTIVYRRVHNRIKPRNTINTTMTHVPRALKKIYGEQRHAHQAYLPAAAGGGLELRSVRIIVLPIWRRSRNQSNIHLAEPAGVVSKIWWRRSAHTKVKDMSPSCCHRVNVHTTTVVLLSTTYKPQPTQAGMCCSSTKIHWKTTTGSIRAVVG